MKLDDTVMVQFFGELIESYRQQIMDQEEARELSKKEKKFLADLRKELELPNPQAYRMVTELFGCMLDISQIKQEQLYIQVPSQHLVHNMLSLINHYIQVLDPNLSPYKKNQPTQ